MAKRKPTPEELVRPGPPAAGIADQPLGPSHRGMEPAAPWSSVPTAPKLRLIIPDPPDPAPAREPLPLDPPVPTIDVDIRSIPHLQSVNDLP